MLNVYKQYPKVALVILSVLSWLCGACAERTICPETLSEKGCRAISEGIGGLIEGNNINGELNILLDEFKEDSDLYGLTMPEDRKVYVLKYSNSLPSNLAGLCRKKRIRSIENNLLEVRILIYINEELKGQEEYVRRTAYHEFGHCFFDLQHAGSMNSIMHKNTVLNTDSWELLVEDLFYSI